MIAVGWRQFRAQATVGLTALVVVGLIMVVTGPHLVSVYDSALAACRASGGPSPDCINPVTATDKGLQIALLALVLAVPALIGMFWGAPLIAHELETGTFRLAWTQSVSRRRWIWVKLGLVGLASFLGAALLSLMVTWWYSPLDKVTQDRFGMANFGLHGFVPGGYAVFAFALAATVGLLIRRTLPAMAVTLVGFITARLAVTYWVRPHYMSPATTTFPLNMSDAGIGFGGPVGAPAAATVNAQAPNLPNAWVSAASVVDKAGHAPSAAAIKAACPDLGGPPPGVKDSSGGGIFGGHTSVQQISQQAQATMQSCLSSLSKTYHVVVTYQPASRFWTFQLIETALFVAAAVALAGGCVWWVRHRIR